MASKGDKPEPGVVATQEIAQLPNTQAAPDGILVAPPSPSPVPPAPTSPASKLLITLKDYKEFVAILIFVVGGAIWIYAAFATKAYVARVQCLLGATIQRIDNDAQSRNLLTEIIGDNVRLTELQAAQSNPIQPSEILAIETLKQTIQDLQAKKSLADNAMKKASEQVVGCGL